MFINVPLAETIPIDADVLYGGELIPPDYVDDTFAIYRSEEEFTSSLDALNSMHSALKFTFEKEEIGKVCSESLRKFENLPNSQKFRGPTPSGRSQGSQR